MSPTLLACWISLIALIFDLLGSLVLQRYKGSRKVRRRTDDPMETEFLLGGHRYGCQYDNEDQAGVDAFS